MFMTCAAPALPLSIPIACAPATVALVLGAPAVVLVVAAIGAAAGLTDLISRFLCFVPGDDFGFRVPV